MRQQYMELFIDRNGCDTNKGTVDFPFKSIKHTQNVVRKLLENGETEIHVKIKEGTYYFTEPVLFNDLDSGTVGHSVIYEGLGRVVFSGGKPLDLDWVHHENGIYKASLSEKIDFDRLSVNGIEQVMARYPSYDQSSKYFDGYAEDSFDQDRIQYYKNPVGAFMHVMHNGLWGDFHYEVVGFADNGEIMKKGGHQNNRPSKMHDSIRYIENIFEELTDENEWYLDKNSSVLYYKPPFSTDIKNCTIVGGILKNIISFAGSESKPVCNIELRNIAIENVGRTFMEPMEPLLRSDWCVYRGGSIFLEGTENITIKGCELNQVGGNGIFISKYNRQTAIKECYIHDAGASSIVFAGDPKSVRSPLFRYEHNHTSAVDWTKGPKDNNYPKNCLVKDCLLVGSGRFEKQSAGVSISMSQEIIVSHNCIYDVPRAGVNICDGTWGGHRIEYNQVFNTVLETSDHGAFNSWGRDRFWNSDYKKMEKLIAKDDSLPMLDAVLTTHINNNIFRCDHGWDIDLDDGSSNYDIYNNLCLSGGIKNREGIRRHVYDNILFNNTFHPHVWFKKSKDRFERNLIFDVYKDIGLNGWGESFDYNTLYKKDAKGIATVLQEKSGDDVHSVYSEKGFNFEDFKGSGLINNKFKRVAKSPFDRDYEIIEQKIKSHEIVTFEGLEFKVLSGLGELSATGMYMETGIFILQIKDDSHWFELGIRVNDVIIEVDGRILEEANHLIESLEMSPETLVIWREQGKKVLQLK
jgi:hypothetical protein